jgi:hypothetical protein
MRSSAETPDALPSIYQDQINLAEWQRHPGSSITAYAAKLTQQLPGFCRRLVIPATDTEAILRNELPTLDGGHESGRDALAADIALLCDMYACLFDLEQTGLRLSVLNKAMCPRFHVDQVTCRLICTYHGSGTEWLSGDVTQQISVGHVALLKGEQWPGNTGRGLVHRSPVASPQQPRLVLTLDPVA